MNKRQVTPNVSGVRLRCSVCLQLLDPGDDPAAPGRPGLTCGLCGAVIFLPASDALACQSCGEPIASPVEGVKLCDGKIVHTLCGPGARTY